MHIGFDAKRAFTNTTGLGNYSRTAINGLCRLYPEHTYTLYTPSTGRDPLYLPPGNAGVVKPSTAWAKALSSFWRSYGIRKQLLEDRVDLYHGLSNELPFALDRSGIKSVVTIHDLIFLRHPELYPRIDRRIYLRKTLNAVKSADRIIAISRQTRNDLVELLEADEQKIRIIYQGCNPWFYAPVDAAERDRIRRKYALPEQYLLYVGTIEERKNLLTIIRALHEHQIDIPLVAVGGKTPYFEKISSYMTEQQVKNIHFHHHIDNADLPGIYQQSEAFIYPSSYEGFGIPVLEALNSGVPVITSKGGCLEETAGEGGMLVEPGDVDALAAAIQNVLSDSALRKDMVTKGKAHAQQFREEHTIPGLMNVYKECLS
jgi:glycosyltransferase involved in cell wall biosynthesis